MAVAEPTHSPLLGQHTEKILTDLNYSEDDIANFRKSRVI